MTGRLWHGVPLLLLALSPWGPAAAQALDDYLAHGYGIVRTTFLHGQFLGCHRADELVFEDGSRLICARTMSQFDYQPRVIVLARAGEQPSVVLIGRHAVSGGLTRLGDQDFARPLPVFAEPFDDARLPDPASLNEVTSATAAQSLNLTQPKGLIRPLNALQMTPLSGPK
jgi:hypothetical protein